MYDIIFCSRHDQNRREWESFKALYPTAKRLTNVKTLAEAVEKSRPMGMTAMRWLVTDDILIDANFDFTWKTETWDRPYLHVWPTVDHLGNVVDEFAGIFLVPNRYQLSMDEIASGKPLKIKNMSQPTQVLRSYDKVEASYFDHATAVAASQHHASSCSTEMYWLIMDDIKPVDDWDFGWRPPVWDRGYVHIWKTTGDVHTGVYLLPRNYQPTGQELQQGSFASIKLVDQVASTVIPYDLFFISYNESNADQNFEALQARFPHARRVNGIKGIHNAHMRCAELSKTNMFWTVDADTTVDQSFDFSYRPPDYDRQYLHLWHSRNPVNGLSYGWGAVKLWPTRLVREFKSNWLDFTTTVGNIKIIPDVIATSNYNCDEISTWRSGFREAVKLCCNIRYGDHVESLNRLTVWLSADSRAAYAHESAQGARAGVLFYLESGRNPLANDLKRINDFDWLIDRFNNRKDDLPQPDRSDLLSILRE